MGILTVQATKPGTRSGAKWLEKANKARKKQLLNRQEAFLTAYALSGYCVKTACEKLGISRYTYYSWMQNKNGAGEGYNDPNTGDPMMFRDRFYSVREELYDDVEQTILKRIREGSELLTIFYAKTQMRHRGYNDREPGMRDEHTEDFDKEQADAMVRAFEISKPDGTVIKGIEGTVKDVKALQDGSTPSGSQ